MAVPIILVVAVGLVCAVMLTIASKVFYVPVDETAAALREVLPGANCGGCGFAGCDDYANQLVSSDGKPVSTYVPFRNGLFLSCAASVALSRGCGVIYYGVHSDDAAGSAYPDCSSDFNDHMSKAISIGSAQQLKVVAPFVDRTKAEVVAQGLRLGVPYELTWSCYEGNDKPCGCCGTCIDRAKAFAANGVKDPALS